MLGAAERGQEGAGEHQANLLAQLLLPVSRLVDHEVDILRQQDDRDDYIGHRGANRCPELLPVLVCNLADLADEPGNESSPKVSRAAEYPVPWDIRERA